VNVPGRTTNVSDPILLPAAVENALATTSRAGALVGTFKNAPIPEPSVAFADVTGTPPMR
jgi:hypothetical protein